MIKKDHRQMLKDIRPFVSFNYNLNNALTKSNKAKITRYHSKLFGKIDSDKNFIPGLTTKGNNIYRPRNTKRKKELLKFVQASSFKELKAIPIKTPGGRKLKIKFSKKNDLISLGTELVQKFVEFFNKEKLIIDPDKEVNRILNKHPKVKSWVIITGGSEINVGFLAENVAIEIKRLMNRYANSKEWLNGLIGFTFNRQKEFDSYIKGQSKSNQSASKATKAIRKRITKRRGIRRER